MPVSLRLTDQEQEKIREKCIYINKILVKMDRSPVRDSELIHAILVQAIDMTEISRDGKIYLKEQ